MEGCAGEMQAKTSPIGLVPEVRHWLHDEILEYFLLGNKAEVLN